MDTHGKPVSGARVILQESGGQDPQVTETNDKGQFWFASLPEGQYDVRAYHLGRISEWRQNLWVSPGRQTNVTLHLHAKASARL
ncbi:MAG: carboxypeptidase regulatory-like domain-containing protein [Acidobacteriota bacterium]|nr:carboxypeptidase regulatory-like domain-containing protein [Acidobacteriota bacterium]